MSQSKENIVGMIDKGLSANRQYGSCNCGYRDGVFVKCNNCVIRDALMISRSCIILSIQRIEILKAKMAAGQKEVEEELRKLMEKEGVGDD